MRNLYWKKKLLIIPLKILKINSWKNLNKNRDVISEVIFEAFLGWMSTPRKIPMKAWESFRKNSSKSICQNPNRSYWGNYLWSTSRINPESWISFRGINFWGKSCWIKEKSWGNSLLLNKFQKKGIFERILGKTREPYSSNHRRISWFFFNNKFLKHHRQNFLNF